MTSNERTTNSTPLLQAKNRVERALFKRTKRARWIEKLWGRKRVLTFQAQMEGALTKAARTLTRKNIEAIVTSRAKLEAHELARVRQVINDEYGSVEKFIDTTQITDFLVQIYNTSGNHVLDKYDLSGSFTLKNPTVLHKLADRSAFLIDSVDTTTKDWLSRQLVKGMEADESWEEIAAAIEDGLPGMTGYRAELIARMETANAVNTAELDFYRQNGLMTKQSVLSATHSLEDECDSNADAGPINVYDTFPSGDDDPPYHVNCACELNTVVPDDFVTNGPIWLGE